MTTYYTNQSGSNGAATTLETGKTTIAAGIALLNAGDTLRINNGTYTEPLMNPPSGVSDSQRTIVEAINRRTVIVNGVSTGQPYTCAIENKNYITISGLVLDEDNADFGMSIGDDRNGFGGAGSSYISVLDCEIKNATVFTGMSFHNSGAGNTHHILIRSCLFHDHATVWPSVDGFDGHAIYPGFHDSIIEYCEFYNIGNSTGGGFIIHQFGSTGPARDNNIYRNNLMHDCYQGILIRDGSNDYVYNNILYNCGLYVEGSGAIRSSGGASGTKIYNNTVFNCGDRGIYIAAASSGGAIVRNNISYQNDFSDYVNEKGDTVESNNLFGVDPRFVNSGSADFRLQSDSPAIDAALTLSDFNYDFFGNARV